MSRSSIVLNLAASLFLAPLPLWVALAYHHAPAPVPVQDGIVALASGFIVYWLAVFLILRLRRRRAGHAAGRVVENAPERQEPLVLDRQSDVQKVATPARRRTYEGASFEDLPDPVAGRDGRAAADLLIDRVADVSQIKRFAEENRVDLLTSWHRNVRESARGDRLYGNWAHEADRVLLSAGFMTRTMTRAETIAVLTAETGAMVEENAGQARRDRHGTEAVLAAEPAPRPAGPRLAPSPPVDSIRQRPAQAWKNRVSTLLGCAGWRIGPVPAQEANGIDLFAERAGKVMALRCVPASAVVDAAAVVETGADAAAFGADHAAVVAADGALAVTPDARDAAAAQGVLLLSEGDLPGLANRLAASGARQGAILAMHPAAE